MYIFLVILINLWCSISSPVQEFTKFFMYKNGYVQINS